MAAEAETTPRRPAGLAAWLAQERVFRLVPFVMVEGMFLLLLALPFALTIYISLLRWRANRPFEQAYFQGFANYTRVLGEPEFWGSLGRTFYFAAAAVTLELVLGFVLAMLVHQAFPRAAAVHHHLPGAHDGRAGGGGLQLLDDLRGFGAAEPDSVAVSDPLRPERPHPLAVASRWPRSGRSSWPTSGNGRRSRFSSSCPGSPPCRGS